MTDEQKLHLMNYNKNFIFDMIFREKMSILWLRLHLFFFGHES